MKKVIKKYIAEDGTIKERPVCITDNAIDAIEEISIISEYLYGGKNIHAIFKDTEIVWNDIVKN